MPSVPFTLSRRALPGRRPAVRATAFSGYERAGIPDPNDLEALAALRGAEAASGRWHSSRPVSTAMNAGTAINAGTVQNAGTAQNVVYGPAAFATDPNSPEALTQRGIEGARLERFGPRITGGRTTPFSSAIPEEGDPNYRRPGDPGFGLSRPLQDPRWRALLTALVENDAEVGGQIGNDPGPYDTFQHRDPQRRTDRLLSVNYPRLATSPGMNALLWEMGLSRDRANVISPARQGRRR